MDVEVLETAELGDRSYVVHAGGVAVVVDPQRDVDRVDAVLHRLGLSLELVVETHIHNDYVTGGLALARRHDARYGVVAAEDVGFDRLPLSDGDLLEAGSLRVTVVATPGHTATHLAYVIRDEAAPDEPPALFSGGSLLYGSVGRTDLVDPARTEELTRAQYHSARRLAGSLPDAAAVYPTHGFGSFCSSGAATGGADSTIGDERARNDALVEQDEDVFVERLIASLTAYPAYYAHMGALNRGGPSEPAASVGSVDPAELRRRLAAGEWVVDLRDRVAYAADHLAGTVSVALGNQFATYVGWLAPWGAPLTVIAETPDEVRTAARQLALIGIDEPTFASGSLEEVADGASTRSTRRASFDDVVSLPAGDVVLDVRRDDERAAGRVKHSVHVPLHALLERADDLPDTTLWVHCASGYRSAIAASLLERSGHPAVYIDDDFSHAVELGLTE